jgi:hypothetical protein
MFLSRQNLRSNPPTRYVSDLNHRLQKFGKVFQNGAEKSDYMTQRVLNPLQAAPSVSLIIFDQNSREILECCPSGIPAEWFASRSRLQSLLQEILGIGSTPRARRLAESRAANRVLNPPSRSCLSLSTALVDVGRAIHQTCASCFLHRTTQVLDVSGWLISAQPSKSSVGNQVRVQVPPSAPLRKRWGFSTFERAEFRTFSGVDSQH